MGDATARLDAALLGLDGFVVVATAEVGGELELLVETTADLVGCPRCGAVARAKDRRPTWVRDLPLGGRPVVPTPQIEDPARLNPPLGDPIQAPVRAVG